MEAAVAGKNGFPFPELGDSATSDLTVLLCSKDGTRSSSSFDAHRSVLGLESSYLAENLFSLIAGTKAKSSIELWCCDQNFDYFVILLRLLYAMQRDLSAAAASSSPASSSCSRSIIAQECCSVKNTIGVAKVAKELGCDGVVDKCFEFLESAPWDENEEDEMIQELSAGMFSGDDPVVARLRQVDAGVVREVFLAAIAAATRDSGSRIKTSAQEQVEYMLSEDDDAPLIAADEQIKASFRISFRQLFRLLKNTIAGIADDRPDCLFSHLVQKVADVAWASRVLSRLDSIDELVSAWTTISSREIGLVFEGSTLTIETKTMVMEIAAKVFEAVGYGGVLLPPPERTALVRAWVPFARETKAAAAAAEGGGDDAFYGGVEAAMNALVLSLPAKDQGGILVDWLKRSPASSFPDFSEAFELWCFRTKSAKRRVSSD